MRETMQGHSDATRPPTRLAVKAWNWIARSQPSAEHTRQELSMGSLLENATRRTKLTDFGDESFIEPLQHLLASINASAGLHPFGAALARTMLGALLCNRLYVENAWSEHFDIAHRAIRQPIIILGLPRTGTTHLFNLLAQVD